MEQNRSLNFRKEKDSLGGLNVPASALYGVQTQRAVDNFPISGLHPWRAFIWSIAAVKRAAPVVFAEIAKVHFTFPGKPSSRASG